MVGSNLHHPIRNTLTDLHLHPQSSSHCASLEKLLALIHPLEDHLTVQVAHLNRVVSSCQQQQVDQGMGMANRTLTHTKTMK